MEETGDQEMLVQKYTGLDAILDRVGGEGRYQIISFLIFSLQWFCFSWPLTGGGFFFQTVQFDCTGYDTLGLTCQDFVCNKLQSQWVDFVAPDFPKVIANSFKTLYACNKDYIMTILSSMVYAGSFVGFFIFPHIADNYGRKIAIFGAWISATIGVLLAAISFDVIMTGFGWFFIGFGANPAITLSYSFINEQSLGKYRQYFSVGIQMALALGQTIIGYIFKGFGNWRPINYILLGLFIFTSITQFYLIQTPRFMIKKSIPKTLDIYNSIARRNKRQQISMQQLVAALEQQPVEKQSSSSVLDLFKYKSLRWINLICGFIFFGTQLAYYSTNFNLDSVGFNTYTNQMFIGVSEFCSYLFAEVLVALVKRKKFSFIGLGLTSIFCFVLITVQGGTQRALSAVLLCAMRFILCSFWAIFYVYQAQLFPTKVRSLSLGFSSACGTIGSFLSPYTVKLAKNNFHISSWIIPGSVTFLAALSVKPLRETFNKKLEDDIQEEKSVSKESIISSRSTAFSI